MFQELINSVCEIGVEFSMWQLRIRIKSFAKLKFSVDGDLNFVMTRALGQHDLNWLCTEE